MNNCFCTLFDSRYLDRGLALYNSLERTCDDFLLWVLCLDDLTYTTLEKLELDCVKLVKLSTLEKHDPLLEKVKKERTLVAYYFTCKSCLCLFVLDSFKEARWVIYLDADLYFYGSPDNIYSLIGDNSIAVTPHRFLPNKKNLEKYGKFNAGCLFFKRDKNGLACLRWWRESCIQWCYDYPEHDRYADQKYIDKFFLLFDGVYSIDDVGINLAPWNIEGKKITICNEQIYVDNSALIFFHFHNLKAISKRVFDIGLLPYCSLLDNEVRDIVYKPYLAELLGQREKIGSPENPLKRGKYDSEKIDPKYGVISACIEKIKLAIMIKKGLREGRYLIGHKAKIKRRIVL